MESESKAACKKKFPQKQTPIKIELVQKYQIWGHDINKRLEVKLKKPTL